MPFADILVDCLSADALKLRVGYVIMIACNIYFSTKYGRSSTTGYSHSYVQPDGLTFSIWGAIYTLLLLMCLFGARNPALEGQHSVLLMAFLLNGAWLGANAAAVEHGESYWATVSILVMYATALAKVYSEVNVNYIEGTIATKLLVYAPLSLALVWAILASIVNFTNTFMAGKPDFTKEENRTFIGGPDWASGVLVLVAGLAIYLALTRSDFVFALGAAWAVAGITRAQTKGSDFPHPVNNKLHDLADTAMIGLILVAVLAFLQIVEAQVTASSSLPPPQQPLMSGEEVIERNKAFEL